MMKLHLNNSIFVLILCIISLTSLCQDRRISAEYYTKGQIKFMSANYEEAILYFTKAIEADSTNYHAWIKRGFSKANLKDFDGEMKDYTAVIERAPGHIWAYISRGSAKNRKNDYKSAIEDFNKAIAIDPKEPEAYNNRGFAKKFLGDFEGACDDWVKSKRLGNAEAKVILKNNQCR